MSKYLICPGDVLASDGDIHFINADQLIQLYQVKREDCIIKPLEDNARGWKKPKDLIELRPTWCGNYSIPHLKEANND